jgi:hypothetical protein
MLLDRYLTPKMRKKRAQAAVEWIVIMSVAILVLAIMLSMNEDNYLFFKNSVKASQAKAAVSDIKNAVDFVYSQGQDARTRLRITIPSSTNLTVATLAGGGGQIQARVWVSGKPQDFDAFTDANLSGVLPQTGGGYCVDVVYDAPAVNISRSGGSC